MLLLLLVVGGVVAAVVVLVAVVAVVVAADGHIYVGIAAAGVNAVVAVVAKSSEIPT